MYTNKRGFTLIELMTVVLILGILSAIAIPQYTRSIRRAEMLEGLTNGKTLLDSALRYKATNGEAPTNFEQFDASFLGAEEFSGAEIDDGNFSYKLEATKIVVTSNRGEYLLEFFYPVVNTDGVFSPIVCCPKPNAADNWLCENSARALDDKKPADEKLLKLNIVTEGCRLLE